MKRWLSLCTLLALFTLTACGAPAQEDLPTEPEKQPDSSETLSIQYSDLSDLETQTALDTLMEQAGISAPRREQFFRHVDQFNEILQPEEQTAGFERRPFSQPKYDPYDLADRWTAAHPEFLGYNCRITAFSLFGDLVQIPPEAARRTEMLPLDLDALSADPSAFPPDQVDAFTALYSTVPTNESKDPKVHAQTWLDDWKDRGITFLPNDKVHLISVVFHQILPEESSLFVAHAGLLFPQEDGTLWFLEKLAFQEPYQCVKFQNRGELQAYLMGKYDLDQDQPMAPPLILENDALLNSNEI